MFQGTCSGHRVSGTGGAGNVKKEAGNQGPKANSGAKRPEPQATWRPLCWETGPTPQWPRAGLGEQ